MLWAELSCHWWVGSPTVSRLLQVKSSGLSSPSPCSTLRGESGLLPRARAVGSHPHLVRHSQSSSVDYWIPLKILFASSAAGGELCSWLCSWPRPPSSGAGVQGSDLGWKGKGCHLLGLKKPLSDSKGGKLRGPQSSVAQSSWLCGQEWGDTWRCSGVIPGSAGCGTQASSAEPGSCVLSLGLVRQ